jgi:hypothetical protein
MVHGNPALKQISQLLLVILVSMGASSIEKGNALLAPVY